MTIVVVFAFFFVIGVCAFFGHYMILPTDITHKICHTNYAMYLYNYIYCTNIYIYIYTYVYFVIVDIVTIYTIYDIIYMIY